MSGHASRRAFSLLHHMAIEKDHEVSAGSREEVIREYP
jgi:hypothetical protein